MESLNEWLDYFNHQNKYSDNINYDDFCCNLQVRLNNGHLVNIDHMQNDFLQKIYYFYISKNTYLTRFYNRNLSLKNKKFKNKNLKLKNKKLKNLKLKNLIRNLYFKEILNDTKTELHSIRSYLDVITDFFCNLVLDYKFVTPSMMDLIINKNTYISALLSGLYFRASIMDPILVFKIIDTINPITSIFTPTLGWSSYCIGSLMHKNIQLYVGTDVIKKVCDTTEFILTNSGIKNDIYCEPSELLLHNQKFVNKYYKKFDLIFFSPPYFKLEIYKSDNQSTTNYTKYDECLEKYWEKTISGCLNILKDTGILVYITSIGYGKYMNLADDLFTITKKYFIFYKIKKITGATVKITKHKENIEFIYFFSNIK